MAQLTNGQETKDIEDGTSVQEAAEEMGVPFGCTSGICGTCIVEVEEGEEHLSEKTQEEKDMDLEGNERLLCQCKINGGLVKIKF